jgi:hypothetical protein
LENAKGRDHLEDLGADWEDNIRMNLRETGWEGVDWIHLAQDRPVASPCEHRNELLASIKGREFLD